MKSVSIIFLMIVAIAFGCTKEQEVERWEEVKFKVALRSEAYKKGDTCNSGEFEDLLVLSIPICVKNGPGEAHAVKDGVWLHIAWDNLVLHKRLNQLGFEGFRRKIDNRFKAPYGTSWWDNGWQELGDVGISIEWDLFQTPVGIDGATGGDPRIWCKMWRWVPRSDKPAIILGKKKSEHQAALNGSASRHRK